ncbi:alpha/beta hydrolase [Robiginitalea sp. SC105]|uniref:alpha/beta hydrolase n=1 Tax=Robiginitalea sp. SC105 TaxID=2762332 RepID=UPI00163B3ABC|nr:alpha/beta hydrolase [Robiginitalea sp. SC105]MBC2840290.1 alpha/beta hydrolase [Robiginitalea sp. SC105]
MVKRTVILGISLMAAAGCAAQDLRLDIWPVGEVAHRIPSGETEVREQGDILRISKVQVPDMEVYLPEGDAKGRQAVLILPGGGYQILAYDWEGSAYGRLLSGQGLVAVVLKYRLPSASSQSQPGQVPLSDAQRALRLIRSNALDWGVDPDRIGVMGFSAGGHLAASLSTRYGERVYNPVDQLDSLSARPDFSILVYPVISFREEVGHSGSRRALLGENPSEALISKYSADEQVGPGTPPAFLLHAADDQAVPVANSLRYYQALLDHKIPASMHLYPEGGHGFSLAADRPYLAGWTGQLLSWLEQLD